MKKTLILVLSLFSLYYPAYANKQVNLQLVWKHQFQFAGYYMAKEKGFYLNSGIDVNIKEFQAGIDPIDDVISGKTEFAVGRSSLLLDRINGKPVVMLAAIFQHSPIILLAKKRDDLKTVADLANKNLMFTADQIDTAPINAMLMSEGIGAADFNIQAHSFNVDDLINDKTDAMIAYVSNEPFALKQKGIDYVSFSPKDYGFDLYSDILFSSQELIKNDPALVHQFYQASIQGWKYAMSHIDETIDIIKNKYNSQNRSKAALKFEAETLIKLIDEENIPLGYINPETIKSSVQLYRLMRLVKNTDSTKGIIYSENSENRWVAQDTELKLSDEEQLWLDKKIPIRYVYDPDWAPFEWTNDVNQHAGIISDLLKLVKIKSGLDLVPVKTKTWAEAIEFAKKRHADMYSGVGITKDRKTYMNFTEKNIFSTPYIFVSRHGEDYLEGFKSLANKKIAVVDGYTIHGILKESRPELALVLLKGTQEGFDKLLTNEIDIFLVNTVTAKYYIAKEKYKALNLAYKTNYSLDLKVAIRNDWPPEIVSIFNKIIASFSEKEVSEIYDKWTALNVTTKIDYTLLYKVAAILVFFILLFIFWNRKLNALVNAKTKDLETQNKVVESQKFALEKLLSNFDTNVIASNTDEKGIITYVSRAFCEISGYRQDELMGQTHAIVRHPDMPKQLYVELWATIKSGQIWQGEIKNRRKNNSSYWVDTIITPEFDSQGKLTGYSAIRHDINAKKEVEDLSKNLEIKVEERTQFISTLLNSQEQLIITTDGKQLKTANQTLLQFYQVNSAEQFIREYGNCICETFDIEAPSGYLQKNMGESSWINYIIENPLETHKVQILKNNSSTVFSVTASPIPSEENLKLAVFTDITNMEMAQRKMKLSSYIIKNAPVEVYYAQKDGIIAYANDVALNASGYLQEELINRPLSILNPSINEKSFQGLFEKMASSQDKNIFLETIHKKKNNEHYPVFVNLGYLSYENSEYMIAYVQDISELKNREEQLETLNKHTRDSIEYAALIQGALIPDNKSFRKYFKDYFAIWHPKDIVGGDIYLVEELSEDEVIIMVIDCTGHGVPGAFVTMLVKAVERQLSANLHKDKIISPANMLGIFNRSIKHLLKQEEIDSISNAGFDGGILYFNKKQQFVRFAGANTPLFIIQNGELKTIKGNRHSIGYKKSDANYEFEDHTIDVSQTTQIYLTTDGYLDQNGGEKGFPFSKKRFTQFVLDNASESFADQQELLLYELTKYQKNQERNDDVTVIGLKI